MKRKIYVVERLLVVNGVGVWKPLYIRTSESEAEELKRHLDAIPKSSAYRIAVYEEASPDVTFI